MRCNSIVLSVLALVVVFSAGCGKRQEAPPPPLARPDLVLDLFDALDKKDYKAAQNKIARLREIDKTSLYLAEMENVVRNNFYLAEAQTFIRKNDIGGAEALLASSITRHGNHKVIVDAAKQIENTKMLGLLIEACNNPRESLSLKDSAVKLEALVPVFPDIKQLNAFAVSKLKLAADMAEFEKDRSFFSVASDAYTLLTDNSPVTATVLAECAAERPSPVYRKLVESPKSNDQALIFSEVNDSK